jgi:hypothetical protein
MRLKPPTARMGVQWDLVAVLAASHGLGVVHEPVDHGGNDDLIAEDTGP